MICIKFLGERLELIGKFLAFFFITDTAQCTEKKLNGTYRNSNLCIADDIVKIVKAYSC